MSNAANIQNSIRHTSDGYTSLHSHKLIVAAIIVVAILIRLPLLFAPLNYSLSDAWRQADTASIAHNFVDRESGKLNIFYPQINWGGSSGGYVEAEFQLFPFLTAILYSFFGEHIWLGRLVSLLFTIATFVVFFDLIKRLVSARSAIWALLFLTFSPLGIRYSTAFMPEATVLFFYVLSIYLFTLWLETQITWILLLAGVSTALAILVKPTSIHIGLIFFLLLYQRYQLTFLTKPILWLFGLISLLPGILWYLHARNLYLTYGNTFGLLSGGDSKFPSLLELVNPLFYMRIAIQDISWVFAGLSLVVFIAGLFLAWRNKLLLLPFGVITIVIYYVMVGRYSQEPWGIQYHIYLLPYAAMGVGLAMARFLRRNADPSNEQTHKVAYLMPGVISIALYVLMSSGVMYYEKLYVPADKDIVACADFVGDLTLGNELLIVSSTSVANDDGTPNNYQDPQMFFYSHRTGWSLAADRHTPDEVGKMRREGAKYFVIYNEELYNANPKLVTYLEAQAQQIGPGITNGCGIYRFND
jgi:4-amino-4-deoxy-L-arabinose transferase-like glycosyltransferase